MFSYDLCMLKNLNCKKPHCFSLLLFPKPANAHLMFVTVSVIISGLELTGCCLRKYYNCLQVHHVLQPNLTCSSILGVYNQILLVLVLRNALDRRGASNVFDWSPEIGKGRLAWDSTELCDD